MHTPRNQLLFLAVACFCLSYAHGYSASRDAKVIAEHRAAVAPPSNHAKVVRQLVHQANYASVGTISSDAAVLNYPMVNVISTDDNNVEGVSTGKIHFMLTDLDFTGTDWRKNNKVTFMFSDEQTLNCQKANKDPMEPTCARAIISGEVKELKGSSSYEEDLQAFENRHPAAKIWKKAHNFYLAELDIKNIYVLDFYGGPHNVKPEDYYAQNLSENV